MKKISGVNSVVSPTNQYAIHWYLRFICSAKIKMIFYYVGEVKLPLFPKFSRTI